MSLKPCVPVSTTASQCPKVASLPRTVGFNPRHEARLIQQLVDFYGWTLCVDGNLYNPHPGKAQGEQRAA